MPDGLASETAVIARLMSVSMTTLMTTKARPGDRVVITGAGPVGFLAAHLSGLAATVCPSSTPTPCGGNSWRKAEL